MLVSYEYNLRLSLRRANSVVSVFICKRVWDMFRYAENLKKLLSANGRSFVQPIAVKRYEKRARREPPRRISVSVTGLGYDFAKGGKTTGDKNWDTFSLSRRIQRRLNDIG